MLVLSRKRDEEIVITVPPSGESTTIIVSQVDIRGDKSRIGVLAPREVSVRRGEIQRIVDAGLATQPEAQRAA